eukprot:CFRG3057T1
MRSNPTKRSVHAFAKGKSVTLMSERASNVSAADVVNITAEDGISSEAKAEDSQLEQVLCDVDPCKTLLKQYTKKMDEATLHIQTLSEHVRSGERDVEKGLDFLHVKLHASLSYCVHMAILMLLKTEGRSISQHGVVLALVKLRGFIERIRPLESKLKYQIDKLVKLSSSSEAGTGDENKGNALRFKPQLEALVQKDADKDREGDAPDEETELIDKSGVYVPPRIAAMPFEDDSVADKREKDKNRDFNKLRDSDIYRELQEEFTEDPKEIKDWSRLLDTEVYDKKAQIEKLRFEEDNYKRVMEPKKKSKGTQMYRSELDSIVDFGSLGSMARRSKRKTTNDDDELGAFKKKRLLKDYLSTEKGKQKGKGKHGKKPRR